jgi:methionine synthase II (cobalamin-independent)
MFATLLGALPRPPLPADTSVDALVEAAVRAQVSAGLDPVTDGGLQAGTPPLEAWRATSRHTDRAVKQVIDGPYTLARATGGPKAKRTAFTLARADTLNVVLRALADAGCPLIEIHEPAATAIGADAAERALFRQAHTRLLAGVTDSHLSLALTGGDADGAGIETLLAAPYSSLAVDLIAGPDNWRLVAATPGDLGIVCGALSAATGTDDGPEILLWAAAYAASTGGRGPSRVGLATASSLAHLTWEDGVRKMERLGAAARLAELPAGEAARTLDPRAVSSRSAALGWVEPPLPRDPDRGHDPT